MIASQVALLNDFLRPSDHSCAGHPGEYEAWWDSSSRDAGRPTGWSREEILDALLLNGDCFYETQTTTGGELAPDVWEEKATNQARFSRGSDFFLVEPSAPHDGRAGRSVHIFRGLHPRRR